MCVHRRNLPKARSTVPVNVELDDFEEWLEGQSDDTVVIVFCASGVRSAAAVEKAKALDHDMIYDLDLEDGLISAQ